MECPSGSWYHPKGVDQTPWPSGGLVMACCGRPAGNPANGCRKYPHKVDQKPLLYGATVGY
eukprot:2340091-Pyramimonas_sp.AAC.2